MALTVIENLKKNRRHKIMVVLGETHHKQLLSSCEFSGNSKAREARIRLEDHLNLFKTIGEKKQ